MKHLLLAWTIVSITSMFVYAFAGVAFWSPLQSGDAVRFTLLCTFHFVGPLAYALSRMP